MKLTDKNSGGEDLYCADDIKEFVENLPRGTKIIGNKIPLCSKGNFILEDNKLYSLDMLGCVVYQDNTTSFKAAFLNWWYNVEKYE